MMKTLVLAMAVVIAGLLFEQASGSHDIFGCGGFVRVPGQLASQVSREVVSHALGQLQVQLKTADGLFKDLTECSPNGYFFVPLYDEGVYRLELEAPEGWSFRPQSAACLKGGADVEFELVGFTVSGLVETSGCSRGAPVSDVEVSLHALSGSDSALRLTTRANARGQFRFEGVPSGVEYAIRARHVSEQWTLANDEIRLLLPWGNVELPSPFVVSGYAVAGYVYAASTGSAGAPSVAVSLYAGDTAAVPLHTSVTTASGFYQFTNVPCGAYTLVARLLAANIDDDNNNNNNGQAASRFAIVPEQLPLTVTGGSATVEQPFRIVGFSIDGQVLHADGTPVADARVFVKQHHVHHDQPAVTDSQGRYRLSQMNVGRAHIYAVKAQHRFADLPDQLVALDSHTLPPIRVTGLQVCGTVRSPVLASPPLAVDFFSAAADDTDAAVAHAVAAASASDAHVYTFCALLPSGRYLARPAVAAAQARAGVAFLPAQQAVSVRHEPVNGVHFDQLLHSVSVSVVCLEQPCSPSLTVTLGGQSSSRSTAADNGLFVFDDVLPGSYSVQVAHAHGHYCWAQARAELQLPVTATPPAATRLTFEQSGFRLVVTGGGALGDYQLHSSLLPGAAPLTVSNGAGEFCIGVAGVHQFTASGCYRFHESTYAWNTASPQPLRIAASHVLAKGRVLVGDDTLFDSALASVSAVNLDSNELFALELQPDNGGGYSYSLWLAPGSARYALAVNTSRLPSLLSYPEQGVVVRSPARIGACPLPVAELSVRPGRFLTGAMDPPIGGVLLDVLESLADGTQRLVATVETDSAGAYRAGPFYDDGHTYQLSPSKDGFEFRQHADGIFYVRKLGSIAVSVRDVKTGQPVAGVLVSLSDSHSYRNNSLTNADGVFLFADLFPGEFYLRPLLKEYTFEPATVALHIREGTQESYEIRATRVSWSVYGALTSLGQTAAAAAGVEIRAEHPQHVEETRTDASGAFRLRGLKPGYSYTIVPNVAATAGRLSRALPARHTVTIAADEPAELRGVNFLALARSDTVDVMGSVAADDEHVNSLRVVLLSRSGGQETELRNHSVAVSRSFIFAGLDQAHSYVVRLEHTPDSANAYATLQHANASADVLVAKDSPAVVIVPLYFSSKLRAGNNFEIDYASLIIAVVLVGGGVGAYKRQTVRHQVRRLAYQFKGVFRSRPARQDTPRPVVPDENDASLDFLPASVRAMHVRTRQRTPKRSE